MLWWIFMLLVLLIVPVVLLVLGRKYEKDPPGEISASSGYRSARSMRNRETWEFAHRTCGRLWRKMGWVMLALTVLVFCFCLGKDFVSVSCWALVIEGVQLAVMLFTFPVVEKALKRTFDEYGKRR